VLIPIGGGEGGWNSYRGKEQGLCQRTLLREKKKEKKRAVSIVRAHTTPSRGEKKRGSGGASKKKKRSCCRLSNLFEGKKRENSPSLYPL